MLDGVFAAYRPDTFAIVCLDDHGSPLHLLGASDVATIMAGKMAEAGGTVAFADHTIADLVANGIGGRWSPLDAKSTVADIATTFGIAQDMQSIVVVETVQGTAVVRGVI